MHINEDMQYLHNYTKRLMPTHESCRISKFYYTYIACVNCGISSQRVNYFLLYANCYNFISFIPHYIMILLKNVILLNFVFHF